MYPVWSQDGSELVYRRFPGGLVAMPVGPGPNLQPGIAETLVDMAASFGTPRHRHWDVSPDGRRFLMIKLPGAATTEADGQFEITLIQNWFQELKELVPVR